MDTQRTTKTEQIKTHLVNFGSISSMEAINNYSATRLSAIIFSLKKRGMDIKTELLTTKDRNGNSCTYAVYKYLNH